MINKEIFSGKCAEPMNQSIIYYIQTLLENVNVPVHFLTLPQDDFTQIDCGLHSMLPGSGYDLLFANQWFAQMKPCTIYHSKDTFHCCYSILYLPENEQFMVCGPVLLEEITQETFLEIARNMEIPEESHPILKDYYLRLSSFPSMFLYQNLFITLGDCLWGKRKYKIEYKDFNDMDTWYELHKSSQETIDRTGINLPIIELRYALEGQILDAVAKGNEQNAQELTAKLSTSFTPHEILNSMREYKNYALAFNTLMRKTVEIAGVHPMHLDLYSRENAKQIEEITQKEQCYAMLMQMIHGYCLLVNTYRQTNYSHLVQKIITYVNTDLASDLSLKSMSDRLSVNASYLSALFKKELGIPLTDYVNRQRIEQAKKLLVITDLPSRMIAQECGISDVYYFNRLFKKITGYTPKIYRENATREHEPLDTAHQPKLL